MSSPMDISDTTRKKPMSHAAIERLMHYYHCLHTPALWDNSPWVTSSRIAYYFNMDDTQVRKDLAEMGVTGRPRQGYKRQDVIQAIRDTLGLNGSYSAVLVGVGRLGGAILEYQGFKNLGLDIVAAFDVHPEIIGKTVAGKTIHSVYDMHDILSKSQPRLAILTCPGEVSQPIAEKLVESGVKAIWNFSTANILVPEDVFVRNEHISVGLAEMAYFMNKTFSTDKQ